MNAVAELSAKANCFGLNLPHGIGANYAAPYIVCRGVMAGLAYVGKAAANRPLYTGKTKIAWWGDVVVYQTAGSRLDQVSADLYFELAQLALAQDLAPGQRIIIAISADELTERLGWGRGGGQRDRLHTQLSYLKTASFLYDLPGLREWQCSFVSDIATDRSTRDIKLPANYRIELNGNMLQVFAAGAKIIPGKVRRQLKPLARALHAFYCTHTDPEDYSDATLKRVMAREGTTDKEWRSDLDAAVTAMAAATGWACNYNRKTGLVRVRKSKPVIEEVSKQGAAPDAGKAPKDTPDAGKTSDAAPPATDSLFAARKAIRTREQIAQIHSTAELLALLSTEDQAEYAEYLARPVNYQRRPNHQLEWLQSYVMRACGRHHLEQEGVDPFDDI